MMLMDKLVDNLIERLSSNQSIIITLDVDAYLFDKLQQIAEAHFSVVEINCIEPALLRKIVHDFPNLYIGAGNVINTQQLEDCHQAGVDFITSPGFLPALAQTAAVYSIHYIPGIATLSEAMHAMDLGCHHVRPFPANLTFCTHLNKCLPLLRLFPAEVEWEDAEHFMNLPSVAGISMINPEVKQLQKLRSESEMVA